MLLFPVKYLWIILFLCVLLLYVELIKNNNVEYTNTVSVGLIDRYINKNIPRMYEIKKENKRKYITINDKRTNINRNSNRNRNSNSNRNNNRNSNRNSNHNGLVDRSVNNTSLLFDDSDVDKISTF